MTIKYVIFMLLLSVVNLGLAENYVLTIDGKPYEISLEKKLKVKVGEEFVSVMLAQKDVFTYKVDNFIVQ